MIVIEYSWIDPVHGNVTVEGTAFVVGPVVTGQGGECSKFVGEIVLQ